MINQTYQQQTIKLFRYWVVDDGVLTAKEIPKNYGNVDPMMLENVIDSPNDYGKMSIIQPNSTII